MRTTVMTREVLQPHKKLTLAYSGFLAPELIGPSEEVVPAGAF